jgi:dynein assembly factor 1, axonemal
MSALMTPETLIKCALEHEGFETPSLNDCLYLHFKGWSKIENLEPFSELKALWLESNGLQKLEGLEALSKLRCLYIQQNLLTKIENIQSLVSLRILDISQNRLTKLENIGCLPCLETLNASKNALADAESIQELAQCSMLMTLDLSNNALDGEADEIVEAIASAPRLISFNLTGNPIMKAPQLRKKFIVRMPKLTYLDRPVFEPERFAAEAWGRGGREAEVNARAEYQKLQKEKAEQETRDFKEWKARKIIERTQKQALMQQQQGNNATPTLVQQGEESMTIDASSDSGGVVEEAEQPEVNVTKMAHKFWSAAATTEIVDLEGQAKGEVAAFRAPSYTSEAVDYEDMEKCVGNIKLSGASKPQPPSDASSSSSSSVPSTDGSVSLPPAVPVSTKQVTKTTNPETSTSFLMPPVPPSLTVAPISSESTTDFDQLD